MVGEISFPTLCSFDQNDVSSFRHGCGRTMLAELVLQDLGEEQRWPTTRNPSWQKDNSGSDVPRNTPSVWDGEHPLDDVVVHSSDVDFDVRVLFERPEPWSDPR